MDVLGEVEKGRKKHRLTLEVVQALGRGSGERAAERRLGMATHGLPADGSVSFALTLAVLKVRQDDIVYDDWQRTRGVCTLAVLDGYTLARAVLGAAPVRRTFKGEGALTRFARTAASSGEGLRTGAHAKEVSTLAAAAAKVMRPAVRALTVELITDAVAAGALLYATERELVFPGLEVRRAPKLDRASGPAAARTEPPPELLAAIFAAPFDDRPRLVYGDWLSEQNDPRGLLIQLQCGPQGEANEGLAKTLIARHQKAWVQPIRGLVNRWAFKRGFINSVTADFSKFMKGLPVLSGLPLLHAKLTGYRAPQRALADVPPHPTVRSVDLSGNRLADRGLELLSAPVFANLTALDLAGNSLDARAVEALVAALPAGIVRLQLSSTDFTTEGLEALSRWKHFGRLTHLDLRYNHRHLEPRTVELLAKAKSLEYLGLSIDRLGGAGIEALAALPLPKLERLALFGDDVGGLPALLKKGSLPALTRLDLPSEVPRRLTDALEARFPPAPWPQHFEY